jgi:hypothetical protein
MEMCKKISTISLTLIMVLSFAACEEEIGEEPGLPSTQEIVDGVLESLDNIRTFRFDMDMAIDISGEADGEAFDMEIMMDSDAIVDLENRKMGIDMTMDMALPDKGEMEIGMKYFLIKDVMYMIMEISEDGPMWMKSEIPAGSWEQMSQTESQIELLKTAQVKIIGNENIQGVDCYVLQLTPDMDQLWKTAIQQAALGGKETLPDVPAEFFQEMFRSFSVKQWIGKDTYYFTKAEIEMAIELTAAAMDIKEGGMFMDITMTLLTYDYNEPVSIVLPPEAESAIEIPIQ